MKLEFCSVNMLLYTFLLMLPFTVAHSWVERLRRLALNGTMIGDAGYNRDAISRLEPAFKDLQQLYLFSPPGLGANLDILPSDPICQLSPQTAG
jgi:hypothetical protein